MKAETNSVLTIILSDGEIDIFRKILENTALSECGEDEPIYNQMTKLKQELLKAAKGTLE